MEADELIDEPSIHLVDGMRTGIAQVLPCVSRDSMFRAASS